MISEEHYMDEHQEQEEALAVVTIRAILEEMKAEINLAAMEIIETEGAEVEVVIVMTDVNVADLQEEEKGVQEDIKTYKGDSFLFRASIFHRTTHFMLNLHFEHIENNSKCASRIY